MRPQKILPRILVVIGCAVLASCLVRIAYNNAELLLMWEIDRYFDINSEQKEFLTPRLQEHLRWHRNSELHKTIGYLQAMKAAVQDGLTRAEVERLYSEFEILRADITKEIAADSVELFARLTDEQIAHLQEQLDDSNREWDKKLELSEVSRMLDRKKRILESVEQWVGPLDDEQEQFLSRASERIPDILKIWLDYSKERQRQFVNLVRSARTDPTVVRLAFPAWSEEKLPAELQAHRAAVWTFILDVDQQCTPQQRAHVLNKIQNWIDDLNKVAASTST